MKRSYRSLFAACALPLAIVFGSVGSRHCGRYAECRLVHICRESEMLLLWTQARIGEDTP